MKNKKYSKKRVQTAKRHSSQRLLLLDISFILNMVLIVALVYAVISDETDFYKGIAKTYESIAKDAIKQSQDVLKTNYDLIGELKSCNDQLPKVEDVSFVGMDNLSEQSARFADKAAR